MTKVQRNTMRSKQARGNDVGAKLTNGDTQRRLCATNYFRHAYSPRLWRHLSTTSSFPLK